MSEFLTRRITVEKDSWSTPTHIVEWIRDTMNWPPFDFDPCAQDSTAKAAHYITPQTGNGLADEWKGNTIWMNPPYSEQGKWLERAAYEAITNRKRIAALVLPSFDAAYFRPAGWKAAREIWILEGRIAFEQNGVSVPGGTVKNCVILYDGAPLGENPTIRYYRIPKPPNATQTRRR